MSVIGPDGTQIPHDKVVEIFQSVQFQPPPGMPMQEAFDMLMQLLQKQMQQKSALKVTPPRGRTAIACQREEVAGILEEFNVSTAPIQPTGIEVKGVDTSISLHPKLVGALEILMADYGLLLFRSQGSTQKEMGIAGKYLTGDQQCELSLAFGKGALHSTHGNHEECPNRDIFRLSNNPKHGFNEVGPEWHNDGSFMREVFGHVVYHIIKAPVGPGNTAFAHLGKAYDLLPPELQARYTNCASVNSNSGVVHPVVHDHHLSGRRSLYLHTGMTGSIIERVEEPTGNNELSGIKAWNKDEMNELFVSFTQLLDRPELCYQHKWEEGDVVVIDNLAVAHKAMPEAHKSSAGLRILHRTTCQGVAELDPAPELGFPLHIDTAKPCPFKDAGAVWVEGYVGFRWGDHTKRSVPH